jgi:hypothetical protein
MHRSRISIPFLGHLLWLALVGSALYAPRALGDDPKGPSLGLPEFDAAPAALQLPAEPTPTLVEPALVAPVPTPAGVEQSPACYWSVSSRRSAQHPREWEGCPLTVCYAASNGALYPSSMGALAASIPPGSPVCICIHGSFVSAEDNRKESAEAYQRLRAAAPGLPVTLIFYTWPSDAPYTYLAPIDIAVRGTRADYNGFHVAWLISNISEDHPVCLFGHSHGCRTAMSAVHLLSGGDIEDYCFTGYRGPNRRIRMVTAAAAFDHNWLNPGQRYGYAAQRSEAILNLQNRSDLPLAFYPLTRPFAHRAIARVGVTWHDRMKLGSTGQKIADWDVTNLIGHAHYWPDYYSRPEIMAAVVPYVYFVDASR